MTEQQTRPPQTPRTEAYLTLTTPSGRGLVAAYPQLLDIARNIESEARRQERKRVVEQIASNLTEYEDGNISWLDFLDAFGLTQNEDEMYVVGRDTEDGDE